MVGMTMDLSVVDGQLSVVNAKAPSNVSQSNAEVVGACEAKQKPIVVERYGKFGSKSPGITPFYALLRIILNARGPRVAESRTKVWKAGMRTWLSALLGSDCG